MDLDAAFSGVLLLFVHVPKTVPHRARNAIQRGSLKCETSGMLAVSCSDECLRWIQAGTAVFIAVLTAVLVVATWRYARAAKRANEIAEENVARIARREAGRLATDAMMTGGSGDSWEFRYWVRNVGGGAVHDATVYFAMGSVRVPASLAVGEKEIVSLVIPNALVQDDQVWPTPQSATFRDAAGDWWSQKASPTGDLMAPTPAVEG